MVRTESGHFKAAEDELRGLLDHIHSVDRRQDALCMFLIGQTLNGDSIISINPSQESWCGRVKKDLEEIKKVALGLEKRFIWGAAFVIGIFSAIQFGIGLYDKFHK